MSETSRPTSGRSGRELADATRSFRPIGNPMPVGLLGLMTASSMFAVLQLHWLDSAERSTVALVVLCAAVLPQLMSGVFGLLGRDPVVTTGMVFLAGAWIAISVSTLVPPRPAASPPLGVLLVCLGVALLVPAAAALSRAVLTAVFWVAAARLVVTGVYELLGTDGWRVAAGALGLALAVVALYAALAFELESARGRALLPTGRSTPVTEQPPPGQRRQL